MSLLPTADLCSSLISILVALLSKTRTTGAKDGSLRVQTHPDSPRPTRIVFAGERLFVRLRQTVPDCSELHGMQKVRGSNPLSSTQLVFPVQWPTVRLTQASGGCQPIHTLVW
jgi:hypothetical protein